MNAKSKYFMDEERLDLRLVEEPLKKNFRLGKLWDVHKEIIRRKSLGESGRSIAEALDVSEVMVSYTLNSKIAKDQLDIIHGAMDADTIDLGIRIRNFAPIAQQLLEDIIQGNGDGKQASVALRARYADKHLDRAGYAPVKKIAMATGRLSRDDIEEIKRRAIASGVIDVEASDDSS